MFSALIDVAVASLVHSSLLLFLYWTIVCLPALILLDFYFTVFRSGPDLVWTDNRPGAFQGSGPWEFLNLVSSALPIRVANASESAVTYLGFQIFLAPMDF